MAKKISVPNEYGVFVNGIKVLEFFGKHSRAEIRYVLSEEGWRGGWTIDFLEPPFYGHSGGPSIHNHPFPTKDLCISSVCALMRSFSLREDSDRYPKGKKEILAWLQDKDPACPHQLTLFDSE